MPRKLDRRVNTIDGHPGEWFVDLTPGYAITDANTEIACHSFGADTRAEIRTTMKRVVSCRCALCVHDLALTT